MDVKAETAEMGKGKIKSFYLSPGIIELMLCSSWRVQWWSEFNGVGKRNSDEGFEMLCCQPGLPAGFADGIIAPEGAMGQSRDCMLSLLPVIQPSDSQTALFPPPHLSSGSNSLSSTERG